MKSLTFRGAEPTCWRSVPLARRVSYELYHFLKRPFSHQYLTLIEPEETVLLR
jgi:hypothetical protein